MTLPAYNSLRRLQGVAATAAALFVAAFAVLAHGDLHARIAAATEQIEQSPANALLYLQRGELHREHLDWKAAETDYDRAQQLDPKLATVDLCRARMLVDENRLRESREMFGRYLARCPFDGSARVERARMLVRLGERKAAVEDFTRALELVRERQPELFLERAQALVAEGQVAEALGGLDEGIKRLGPIVTLQLYALDLEMARKNYDAALARLETVESRAARKENWLARRGEIELLAGRPAEARRSFEAALAAVNQLPGRLRESDAMAQLKSRVTNALAGLANAPAPTNTNQTK